MPVAQKENIHLNISYSAYYAAGITVIPEINKIPSTNGIAIKWGKFYRDKYKPSDEELLEWDLLDNHNIALITGECSGIIALDFDHANKDQIEKAIKLLGDTPCKKFGSKGVTLFYKWSGEKNNKWEKDGKILCELLSDGRKTTIPPSIHTETKKPYTWIGKSLLECYKELPELPKHFQQLLDDIFLIVRKEPKEKAPSNYYDTRPEYNEAIKALNYCDANCSHIDWWRVGSALKSEFGDAAFTDFDSWSSSGKTYDKRTIRSQWRSMDSHSIGYGTLIYYAKERGYEPPKKAEYTTSITSIEVENWEKNKLEEIAKKIKDSETPPDFYLNAPPDIKMICDFIVNTAYYKQPIITLGSVISMLGFIMGKNCDFQGIKPNLYIACLAGTGDGKEHILRCIRGIFDALDLRKHRSEKWTSDTAIIQRVSKADGYLCYIVDEMYTTMKALAQKGGNIREQAATSTILQGYTGVEISTTDYADDKDRPTVVVKKPFISLLGFSTPEPFYDAIGSTEAFSGLVGRMTVFQGNRYLPEPNEQHDSYAWENIPSSITNIIQDIQKNSRTTWYDEKQGRAVTVRKKVDATPEAEALIKDMEMKIRDKRNILKDENPQMEKTIVRIGEMTKKYALIASGGKQVTVQHIEWAKSVAEYNLGLIMEASSQFVDNDFQKKVHHALDYIKKQGGMVEKSKFTKNCTRFNTGYERKQVIETLIEGGQIQEVPVEGDGKRKVICYKIVA